MKPSTVVLSRAFDPTPWQVEREETVVAWCASRGIPCTVLPHLYHLPDSCGLIEILASRFAQALLPCWMHPRPARWLMKRHRVELDESAIVHLGAVADNQAVLTLLESQIEADGAVRTGTVETFDELVSPRWYPIIDGSRCIHCGHCLQFCLFNVYTAGEGGRVEVAHPEQCKTGCPACARVCPQSAIVFALYEEDAAIAGAPGCLVMRDDAARRMFYTRTQQTCPRCGQRPTKQGKIRGGKQVGPPCPECGFPSPLALERDAASSPAPEERSPPSVLPFDDLDRLVDQLDRTMQQRR